MIEQDTELNWYALKVFYNKVFDIEESLEGALFETYIPVKKVELKGEDFFRARRSLALNGPDGANRKYIQEGPRILRRIPVVASLMFVKAGADDILRIKEQIEGKGFVYLSADRKKPAVIPQKQMAMFRLVASSGDEGLEFFSEAPMVNFSQGDKVRVKEGPLKGAEGYIKRIKKDRRLLVAIQGIIAVATSFIPPALLEKVEE
jgi:transcription antitermination factor NusG